MQWYYGKDGKQEGPIETEALQGMIHSGPLAPSDLVWREGMAEWSPVANVPELSQTLPVASPAPAPPVVQPEISVPGAVPGAAPGAAPQAGPVVPAQAVPNNLVWAILVTVLCCLPFGIVSIVYAAKVDGLVRQGDIPGAIEASNKAKTWALVALGAGIVGIIAYVLLVVLGAMAEASSM